MHKGLLRAFIFIAVGPLRPPRDRPKGEEREGGACASRAAVERLKFCCCQRRPTTAVVEGVFLFLLGGGAERRRGGEEGGCFVLVRGGRKIRRPHHKGWRGGGFIFGAV